LENWFAGSYFGVLEKDNTDYELDVCYQRERPIKKAVNKHEESLDGMEV